VTAVVVVVVPLLAFFVFGKVWGAYSTWRALPRVMYLMTLATFHNS